MVTLCQPFRRSYFGVDNTLPQLYTVGMKRTRVSDPDYPRRVSLYETDEGMALLKELARRRSVSIAALMRLLVREEAKRLGVKYEALKKEQSEAPGE